MDFEEEMNGKNPKINYWEMFRDYTMGELKDEVQRLITDDPEGVHFKKWLKENGRGVMDSYIWGLSNGVKAAGRICLDDFATYVYVMANDKNRKSKASAKESYKPEPMKPKRTEMDKLFEEKKIQDEIDNMLNDVESGGDDDL